MFAARELTLHEADQPLLSELRQYRIRMRYPTVTLMSGWPLPNNLQH